MLKVSGQKDPVIKLVRDMISEDGRRKAGKFIVEEREIVRRAFCYGAKVEFVVFSERFVLSGKTDELQNLAKKCGAQTYSATEGLLSKILESKPIPDCLAVVERKIVSIGDCYESECPLSLMVEHGENADNLGMLLRTADAMSVDGVILADDTVDPFSRRVVRGSRGAIFTLLLNLSQDITSPIEEAQKRGIQVIASSANANTLVHDVDLTKPSLLVVGNEHVGITDKMRELADSVVRIPMMGRINSLNVSIAASILMYEAQRQRKFKIVERN